MVKLIILLRDRKPTEDYEERYNRFLMLLDGLPGLRKKAVNNVYSAPGGLVHFRVVIEAYFDDPLTLQTALTSPEGVEAGNELLHFAGPDAVTLFVEIMEDDFSTA